MYNVKLLPILSLIITVLLSSQVQAQNDASLKTSVLESAISAYNAERSLSQPESQLYYGKTTVEYDEVAGTNRVKFFIQDRLTMRHFSFQYEKDQAQVKLPTIINKSRITFLGEQLIVENLETAAIYSFVIDGFEARLTELPSKAVIGIGTGSEKL